MRVLILAAVLAAAQAIHNQELVDRINSNPRSTFRAKLYPQFANKTHNELLSYLNPRPGVFTRDAPARVTGYGVGANLTDPARIDLPETYDLRVEYPDCIGPTIDQGACGNCYCVATVLSFSDMRCIHAKDPEYVEYSALYQTRCDDNSGHCNGGIVYDAWSFLTTRGATTSECIPYDLGDYDLNACLPNCRDGSAFPPFKHARGWKHVGTVTNHNVEDQMQAIVQNGPLTTCFSVCEDFYAYESGVYSPAEGIACGSAHCIEIVGYGTEDDTPYWVVKNTWGESWGENGFMKFLRGENTCLIEEDLIEGFV